MFEEPNIEHQSLGSLAWLLSGDVSREMMAFGMKGAALAAFGEMPAGFFVFAVAPFGERNEGVKLGESTLRAFFNWLSWVLA